MKRTADTMRLLLWVVVTTLAGACANMGRPDGGARDETPPRYVRSNPAPGALNMNRSRMTVTFDENIQLEDAFNKVVVSPAQKTPPQVSANGRTLTVNFRDTLRENTSYTIDFADAIKDLNEGNILDGFALDFSTGPTLDTLRISGMVLQAENLEPAQGMLVGVYANYTDTSLTTVPFDRIARTNQLGQFTIRNLPAGEYRIFAINDINRDYHWDRSEDIAFYDSIIVPTTEQFEVTDTLYSSTGEDSLVTRPGLRYLPNDILLTWSNLNYKQPYLGDYKRTDQRRLSLNFGAPQDSLPVLTIVDGAPGAGRADSLWALRQQNVTGDTLTYWIADTAMVAHSDSLRLAVRYQKLDSAEQLVWTTDTLRFFYKNPDKNKKKKKDKDKESTPTFTVDSVTGDTTFLPPPDLEYLGLRLASGTTQELGKPIMLETTLPLAQLDTAAVKLEMQEDTVWKALPVTIRPDSLSPLLRQRIDVAWVPGGKYRLTIDSMALQSIYGPHNKPLKQEITAKKLEDYSGLSVTLPGLDSITAVVELLNGSDKPLYRTVKAAGESKAVFKLLNPSQYYLRLFIDDNGNGKWDQGDVNAGRQPEEVYYFAKKLNLKKNWDVEQTWDITELPLDQQKPYAIKKNRPKLKRGEKAPTESTDTEEDELGYSNPFDDPKSREKRRRQGSEATRY